MPLYLRPPESPTTVRTTAADTGPGLSASVVPESSSDGNLYDGLGIATPHPRATLPFSLTILSLCVNNGSFSDASEKTCERMAQGRV